MGIDVAVLELPSFRVAALTAQIEVTQSAPEESQKVGKILSSWAAEAGVGRDRVRGVKGVAILEGDWASHIAAGAPPEKRIPLSFSQARLLGQDLVPLERLRDELSGGGTAEKLGLEVRHTPPGLHAVIRHKGSYVALRATLARLAEWIQTSDYEYAGGPLVELYLAVADDEVPESEFLTDLCIPIKKKGSETRPGTLLLS